MDTSFPCLGDPDYSFASPFRRLYNGVQTVEILVSGSSAPIFGGIGQVNDGEKGT
jgi:hypothetical protein